MTPAAEPWILVADIGGTNARFAAVPRGSGVPSHPFILPTKGYPSLEAALDLAIPALGGGEGLTAIVLALAAAIDDGPVKLTNAAWVIDARAVAAHTGVARVELRNDFEALALALPFLGGAALHSLQAGEALTGGNIAVVGPGTGLGVAGLIAMGGGWRTLCGEGGHATYAPETETEWRIATGLRAKYGRVSAERVATGQGLVDVAAILGAPADAASPAQVVARAHDGCAACRGALDAFLACTGRVAGDVALTLNATAGVFLGGGILPRLVGNTDLAPLVAAFRDKGRNAPRMARMPMSLIVDPAPALTGLAAHARELFAAL